MAAACEITAVEFLQGSYRQKLVLPRCSTEQNKRLLWGTLSKQIPPMRISRANIGSRPGCSAKFRAVLSRDVSSPVNEEPRVVKRVSENLVQFYRIPLFTDSATSELLKMIQTKVSNKIIGLKTEQCFNIGVDGNLSSEKLSVLNWLLSETYEPENLANESFLDEEMKSFNAVIVEVGPRLSFSTAWSANAVSICQACGLTEVNRLERSRRYMLYVASGSGLLSDDQISDFAALVHDRMTECIYDEKLTSFETNIVPENVRYIPVMERGRKALEEINEEMGLALWERTTPS